MSGKHHKCCPENSRPGWPSIIKGCCVKPVLKSKKIRFAVPVLSLLFLACCLSGCTLFKNGRGDERALVRLSKSAYPEFSDHLFYDRLENGILKSIEYLKKLPPDRKFRFEKDAYPASHLILSLETFSDFIKTQPSHADLNAFIRSRFIVYRSIGGPETNTMLFTGYYEPWLKGNLEPDEAYPYPVYSMPDDLIRIDLTPFSESLKGRAITGRYTGKTVVPYPDRKAIEGDKQFHLKAPPIAWVDDPIGLFFLQIQGSGKIVLKNGGSVNVHYHGANGREYRSIGRLLIDDGKIDKAEMSMQRIKQYLKENPDEIDAILNYNKSYVFFKTEEPGPPLGALGVGLTPVRSIAVDRKTFPMATLSYLKTQTPVVLGSGEIDRWTDFSAFALNQDTGGAIKGPGRADIFWGGGDYAEVAAGHLQHPGELYMLVLDPETLPVQAEPME